MKTIPTWDRGVEVWPPGHAATTDEWPSPLVAVDPVADIRPGETKIPWLGIARAAAALAALLGAAVLVGWVFGVDALTRPLSDGATMKSNTAIALLLLGVAVPLCAGTERTDARPRRWAASVLATTVVAIGLITLAEHVFNAATGLDDLVTGPAAGVAARFAHRPAAVTALLMVMTGCSLTLIDRRWRRAVAWRQLLAAAAALIAYCAILGHAYGANIVFNVHGRSAIALTTAIGFLLVATAILAIRPFEGWMPLFTTERIGSTLARRLLPAAIVGTPLVGLGRVAGTTSGLFDDRFGSALAATVTMSAVSAVIVAVAVLMNREQTSCEAELAAERLDARLIEAVMRHSESLFAIRDLDGRLLYVNPTIERWSGVPVDQAIGHTYREAFAPEVAEERERFAAQVIQSAGAVSRDLTVTSGGRTSTRTVTKFPIKDARGRMYAIGTVATDITERRLRQQADKRLNDQLEREARRAQEAITELQSFAHTVSHDLRSPLRAIDGFTQVVEADYAAQLDARGRHYLDRIHAGTHEMNNLIDDLLEFSRIGRADLRFAAVDMTAVAHEANEALAWEREGRDVRVTIGELSPAFADEHFMGVVFANLLSNAHKYTRPRPEASITVGSVPPDVGRPATYFVRDNGIGFDMRRADKLFLAFEKLHRDGSYEGSGVGLATVERVLRRHDGCVWAQSEPDVGTTIYFQLARESGRLLPERGDRGTLDDEARATAGDEARRRSPRTAPSGEE